jgi:ATP-dependent DNA helicase RecQ
MPEWLNQSSASRAARKVSSVRESANKKALPASSDTELREYLREWRRVTAKEQGVPAFVVLHDTSLEEICRVQPASIDKLLTITGIGERKADLYGKRILSALARYRDGARASAKSEKKTAPALETLQLLRQGKTLEEIAKIRERQLGTVVSAVTALVEEGQIEFQPQWIDRNKQAVIEAACTRVGLEKLERLKTLKDALPPEITYDEIRLVLAHLRREQGCNKAEIPA